MELNGDSFLIAADEEILNTSVVSIGSNASSVTTRFVRTPVPASSSSTSSRKRSASISRQANAQNNKSAEKPPRKKCHLCPKDYANDSTLAKHLKSHKVQEVAKVLPDDDEIVDTTMKRAPAVLQGIQQRPKYSPGDEELNAVAAAVLEDFSDCEASGVTYIFSASLCICQVLRTRENISNSKYLLALSSTGLKAQLHCREFSNGLVDQVRDIILKKNLNCSNSLLHNFNIVFLTALCDDNVVWILRKLNCQLSSATQSSLHPTPSLVASEEKALYFSIGSVVKGGERRCSSKPRIDPGQFTEGADAVPRILRDFTIAQNRGLKLSGDNFYKYSHNLTILLKKIVWKDITNISHDIIFSQLQDNPSVLRLWDNIIGNVSISSDDSVNSFEFYTRKIINTFMRGAINVVMNYRNPKGSISLAHRPKLASGSTASSSTATSTAPPVASSSKP